MGAHTQTGRAWRVGLVAAIAAAVLAGGVADADPGGDGVGAPGIGDGYFPRYGNGGYEVDHYDVRLQYDPATDRLWGATTILARATQDVRRFNLDFGLPVSSITVNGRDARHATSPEHELEVTPARELTNGQRMSITVRYDAIPSQVKIGSITAWRRTSDGAVAVGQPQISNWWFPSNDHPLDKATYDISVGVPTGVEVVANGVQPTAPAPYRPGWTRWSWRTVRPMQTYLAFVAIGQYDVTSDVAPDGKPVVMAYSENMGDAGPAARASIEQTLPIAEWAKGIFGAYPFEAYGGVGLPQDSVAFALETQTRPVYGLSFFRGGSSPYVVVHELTHQWYGNSTALADWRDIWLHEGFATYAQWMYSEHIGEGTAQELFDFNYDLVPANDPFWQVKPGDPGAANIFHLAVYRRGAMALHQLRLRIGDEAFFPLLRGFTADRRYGNANVAAFVREAERVSGQQLTDLFDTWLYTTGRPPLPASAAARSASAKPPRSAHRIVMGEAHGH
ncbi:M1 family metallopeptidase [Tenggerimyces flavus]|uniref:Aminopeptidase N n=1 Tax=Tenggerimyces flavus TaxID=1708749 RepID=A0ABV7Y9D4_9ACTN|nr:M1 family metallopeptidase [Tenggerimyces flavus]MBM7786619.1 aminopeptidase N [Tenggerimyces flavus]